jgi:predicted small lipoprotein YifL
MRSLAALLMASAAILVGCGSAGPSEAVDASAELETQIRQQLPAEAKRLTGSRGFVSNVGCVHSGGNSYSCLATISAPNAYGEYVTERLPIDGTCDARECIWKVAP